jgi:glycosyltransferase involved in cell wall biosynthesis
MVAPKVVHVTSAHPASDVRIFRKQCRTLAAAGYDVVFVVPHDRDEIVDGVRIRAIPPARGRFERMTRTARRAIRAAAAEHAQIYHLHNEPELLLWSLPLRLRGNRIIFDMHENLPKQIFGKPWLPGWTRGVVSRLARGAQRVLLPGMPVVFAHMSYETDHAWVGRSATVLNVPLADELLAISEPKHPVFTVSYLGRVSRIRGFHTILDAAEMLARKKRRLEFECVGLIEADEQAEVAARASRAMLPVRVSGQWLPPNEAYRMTARCHAGFVILKNVPNNYSNWPTKMFEYMALGVPVIASNFPFYRSVVEGSACGLCVDPDSPEELAEAIEWLMDHPGEAAEMGRRGRDAIRHQYNWNHEAAKLLRFYDELLTPTLGASVTREAQVR